MPYITEDEFIRFILPKTQGEDGPSFVSRFALPSESTLLEEEAPNSLLIRCLLGPDYVGFRFVNPTILNKHFLLVEGNLYIISGYRASETEVAVVVLGIRKQGAQESQSAEIIFRGKLSELSKDEFEAIKPKAPPGPLI